MKLYQHQKRLIKNNPNKTTLVWEMGTGKTIGAIALYNAKRVNSALIICPKGLRENWERELSAYAEFNYEVLTKEEFRRDWKEVAYKDSVIVDEAHHFLGTKSDMMKSLRDYFKKHNTPIRTLLTGTPYRSSPWDIYVLTSLLGFQMNWMKFKDKFFYEVPMGARRIPKVRPGAEKGISAILKNVGDVVRLDECADVPEQVHIKRYVTLNKEQEKKIINIKEEEVTPIVLHTKIHQICGGTVKGDEFTDHDTFECEKREMVLDLWREHCGQMIVVCRYNLEIQALEEYLKKQGVKGVRSIHGGVTDRDTVLRGLSPNGVLIVNAACGEGWELPDCSLMVFYSHGFSFKDYVQMQGRILRINNLRKNRYVHLVTGGTIDERVIESLENKEDFHIEIYSDERGEVQHHTSKVPQSVPPGKNVSL